MNELKLNPTPGKEGTGSLTIESDWLDTAGAAEYLAVSPNALRNMTSNGKVPYHKLGRRNRYKRSELNELLLAEKRGS